MWVPSGGYFTDPTNDCEVLAMAPTPEWHESGC